MNLRRGVCLLLLYGTPFVVQAAERIPVSDLKQRGLSDWQVHSFKGYTDYRLSRLNDTPVIHAVSHGTASGLFKKLRIDLDETPYLNWQWRIEGQLKGLDEHTQAGDDYSARVYVIREGGWLPWQTRALNYVWSSNQAVGSVWPNAFTDRTRMIAVRSGAPPASGLLPESRNVKADFARYFDQAVRYVDVIALMTDSDNSGQRASAYYGDLYFSREPAWPD